MTFVSSPHFYKVIHSSRFQFTHFTLSSCSPHYRFWLSKHSITVTVRAPPAVTVTPHALLHLLSLPASLFDIFRWAQPSFPTAALSRVVGIDGRVIGTARCCPHADVTYLRPCGHIWGRQLEILLWVVGVRGLLNSASITRILDLLLVPRQHESWRTWPRNR